MAKRTPIKAIRAKCIDCCGNQIYEVKKCTIVECPLYEYRMGHRPKDEDLSTNDISNGEYEG